MKIKLLLTSLLVFCWAQFSYAQEPAKEEPLQWYQVQKKAEFPGGDAALDKYIVSNFNISKEANKKAKSGTIVVKFIVEKDGSLSDVKISSNVKIGYGCEQAAVNVIKGMPKWSPALQRDAPCRMEFQKPIRLTFN